MIMVLIIAFCFWYGGYAFKNPEKVWEYQHFLTVKDGTPTLFSIYFIKACGILLIVTAIGMLLPFIEVILNKTIFK